MAAKFAGGVEGFLVYVVMVKRSDEDGKIIVAICNVGLAISSAYGLHSAFNLGISAYLSTARSARDPQPYLLLWTGGGFSFLDKP
jgi:hypothetical protein